MKIGILVDLAYDRHHLFKSYFHAIQNIYEGHGLVVVHGEKDLTGVDILFIADDHYLKDSWFPLISYCNKHAIRVVALTNEKVHESYFPWNEENLVLLNRFKHLTHYMNDVDDCLLYGTKLNRTAPSFNFKKTLCNDIPKKYNHMVFVGKTKCPKNSYAERNAILEKLSKTIQIDVYNSNIPTWEDYIKIISRYKYVFSPIGNGNFFPMRFYEALAVGSIPVHQVRSNTLDLYNVEKTFNDCIFFEDISEIKGKIENMEHKFSINKIWMEDNLLACLQTDNLL